MNIESWTLVTWIVASVPMLVFLQVCLARICSLSCDELSCIRDTACKRRDAT